MSELTLFAQHFIALFIESAPWLLLGLVIAGVMHELVPVDFLQKHMGNNSLASIIKAALIGAPLPLCSCGVIPAALGLRRSGASKSSTVSFLVATPETGVDSVSVSYALLGPIFAIVRPIAAVLSAIYAGVLVKMFDDDVGTSASIKPEVKTTSCCSPAKPVEQSSNKCNSQMTPLEQSTSCASQSEASCCEPAKQALNISPSVWQKTSAVLSYASGKLLSDITFWLMLGLGMAALIQTFVPTDFLTQWGDGFIAMLVMALIGIPMYICATASTPLALGFLAAGLSPGAVLVFMLAGPATNVSTMGMIGKEMGKRTLTLYLFAVISAAITLGYGLNVLWVSMQWALPSLQMNVHQHTSVEWLYYISALIMATLMIRNTLLKYKNVGPVSSAVGKF